MIKHIVMFKLHEFDREEDKLMTLNELKSRIEALPSQISQIRSLETGLNARDLSWAYDLVLVMEFDSMEDVEVYTVHPAHQAFVAFNADKSAMKAIIDYKLN